MDYHEALKKLSFVGVANATGDVLRASHAQLIARFHGGDPLKYFNYLKGDDKEIHLQTKRLLDDRALAWDVLMSL